MKPVTQTLLVEKHGRGNCMAAAIASLFEMEIDQLPPFYGETSWDQYDQLKRLCKSKGLVARREYPRNSATPGFTGYYIACGESPRGRRHACVYKDHELAHDPHPSREGILSVDEVMIFVPFDISKWTKRGSK